MVQTGLRTRQLRENVAIVVPMIGPSDIYDRRVSTGDEPYSCVEVIRSLQKLSTPGAVDLTRVLDLGDVPQVVSVRGRDRANPVLLFVHGGPGTPLMPTAWMWQRPVEEFFTVVHYDQRGAGRSFRLSDPDDVRSMMHPAQYTRDAVQLVEWLRGELSTDRVVIAGHSWGTVIAIQAVLERPELFSAYLGIGQLVDFRAGERASFAWVRDEARRRGDDRAVKELEGITPYPGDGVLDMRKIIIERQWVQRYGGFAAGRADCDYFMYGDVISPDYSEQDRDSTTAGNALHGEVVLPQLTDIDFTDVTHFPVPIIQFLGRHDQMTPAGPVTEWMNRLTAPLKVVEWFEDSAHMLMYEEPGHFLSALLSYLRPLAVVDASDATDTGH
jgi:pimeloyl-ACP methyl ester carboxylesterase